jgi:glycerophosphoryl diester phosphodiesterase
LVTHVGFTPAATAAVKRGLLGYVSCVVSGVLRIECTVRRTADGQPVVSFPTRRDRAGRSHSRVAPANTQAHSAIEAAVLLVLEGQGHLPRSAP